MIYIYMNCFIVFTDLKGYSKLSENEADLFFNQINPALSVKIKQYLDRAEAFNTWGDSVVAAFADGKDAVDLMLDYRDFFSDFDFGNLGMTCLMPRLGGHYGELHTFPDQLLDRINMYGSNINTAARIEPVTRAGEIFVTRQFKEAIKQMPQKLDYICFDELGIVELAKSFGERELFRLRYNSENPQVIDKIYAMDLSGAFPSPPPVNREEKSLLELYCCSNDDAFRAFLVDDKLENRSGEFYYRVAVICKNFGLYDEAISLICRLEKTFIITAGIKMYPFKHRQDVLKLKANCLTRLGHYEMAADIVYSLWQQGMKDSDTLSMLAAQYKRRALVDQDDSILVGTVNKELLHRAKDLYLEAFRRNIEDYYPAINAAYLYRFLGGSESETGIKLARYVMNSWHGQEGENWWLDSTLAESQILQDCLDEASETFARALERHHPDSFERSSVIAQISTYATLLGKEKELEGIIDLLSQNG